MSDRDDNQLPEILNEKYSIQRQLANKGGRKTLLARHLSTQELAELPQTDLKIEFESATNVSENFNKWLKKITEPLVSKRFRSVNVARKSLDNPDREIEPIVTQNKIEKPNQSKIILNKSDEYLEIIIYAKRIFSSFNYYFLMLLMILFSPSISKGFFLTTFPATLAIISIIFFSYILTAFFGQKRLYIDRERFLFTKRAFFFPFRKHISCPREDIITIEISQQTVQFYPSLSLKIGIKTSQLKFFDTYFPLTSREVEWLAQELSEWLNLPIIR